MHIDKLYERRALIGSKTLSKYRKIAPLIKNMYIAEKHINLSRHNFHIQQISEDYTLLYMMRPKYNSLTAQHFTKIKEWRVDCQNVKAKKIKKIKAASCAVLCLGFYIHE